MKRRTVGNSASPVATHGSKTPSPQRLDFSEAEAELPVVDSPPGPLLRRSPRVKPRTSTVPQDLRVPMQKRHRTLSPTPTPKRHRVRSLSPPAPLQEPRHNDFDDYPKLNVVRWDLIKLRFGDVEGRLEEYLQESKAIQQALAQVSQRNLRSPDRRQQLEADLARMKNRQNKLEAVLGHAGRLRDEYRLYNVGPLFKLLDAKSRFQTLQDCINRLTHKIKKSLLDSPLGDKYTDFWLRFEQYRGFDPCKTQFDDHPYMLRIYGQKKDGDPHEWKSQLIFGSLGLREAESLMCIQGEDFTFYPFVLGTGDATVMKEVYRHLFLYHDGPVRAQHFSITDMWRIIACCLFYSARLKLDARTINVTITIADRTVQRTFADKDMVVNVASLVKKYIERLTEPVSDSTQLINEIMSADQVLEVRSFIQDELKVRYKFAWDDRAISIRGVKMTDISIKSDGSLKFGSHLQALSFLYFYSKYRTRAYLHPLHGISDEDLDESHPPQDDATVNLDDDSGNSDVTLHSIRTRGSRFESNDRTSVR